jgi:hypothetical protein
MLPGTCETPMPTLPADDDYAHSLLTIFRAHRLHARQSLRLSDARADFLSQRLGYDPDFSAAVDFAIASGWLTLELDRLRLSERGDAEA